MLAFGMFALILAIALVVGDQSAAGACSCASVSVAMSTIVGEVEGAEGDAVSFVNVMTVAGPTMPDRVVVQIHGRRPSDPAKPLTTTSCDVAFDQPAVGGVYRLTVNPVRPTVSYCGGSVSLVTAPPPTVANPAPADTDDDGSIASAVAVGGGLAVVAGVATVLVARAHTRRRFRLREG